MVHYLIKEITGSVRRTSLWDKASEGHAIQNLGQEIILNEASLAKEGSLDNIRIKDNVIFIWAYFGIENKWPQPFLKQDSKSSKTAWDQHLY